MTKFLKETFAGFGMFIGAAIVVLPVVAFCSACVWVIVTTARSIFNQ